MKHFFLHTLLYKLYIVPLLTLLAIVGWFYTSYDGDFQSLWMTNDQRAYRYFEKKEYKKAETLFVDKAWKATSYYRDSNFTEAAKLYGDLNGTAYYYNRGNAFTMFGQYYYAVENYDKAIKEKPDFKIAIENRAIADKLLREKMARENKGEVKNPNKKLPVGLQRKDNNKNKKEPWQKKRKPKPNAKVHVPAMALWLDRLQTTPKEFLKHKFAYQYAKEENATK